MNRRTLLKGLMATGVVGQLMAQASHEHGKTDSAILTPDQAFARLMEGNKRFLAGQPIHPHQDLERVKALAKTQSPFAVVLGCADSRVDPELIFDQGLGDIFQVRVAGNIVDDAVLGSVEYAVEHLSCPLILVLGHEKCGAVTAAVGGGEPGTHIMTLVNALMPAVSAAKGMPGDAVSNVVRVNIKRQAEILKTAKPILDKAVSGHKIKVMTAIYDIATGEVKPA